MGCRDSFQIEIVWASGFQDGSYTVSVQAELESAEIQCTIPSAGCQCQNPDGNISACIQGGSLVVAIEGRPVWADVVLSTNGLDLVNNQFTAHYEKSSPNGESCGPTCWQAHEKQTL